ncbi:unnamed protein product, partial [Didymodactylos carnosus]
INTYRAGLKKHTLVVDDNIRISYCVRGEKNDNTPTLLFVHGLSSDKETWLSVIKDIPASYHCIALDLPGHGDTIGFKEDSFIVYKVVDVIKAFINALGLVRPLYLIGISYGGAIASLFAAKYPQYVNRLAILAAPAGEICETEVFQTIRAGTYDILLPSTIEQLYTTIGLLSFKKINVPKQILNGYLNIRNRHIEEHSKVLNSLLSYDYQNLDDYYSTLKNIKCPTMILWGYEDKLFTRNGAQYFHNLIPHAEVHIIPDCGHLMADEHPEQIATILTRFMGNKQE